MNVLSGLMISITRIIQLEDWVEVEALPLRGWPGSKIRPDQHHVTGHRGPTDRGPDAQIINGKVINYTRAGFVAIPLDLWLDSSTDLKTIRRIVLEVADLDPCILPKVNEEERRIMQNVFERPYIRNLFGGDGDLSRFEPPGEHPGPEGGEDQDQHPGVAAPGPPSDEIVSGFLVAVRDRFKLEGIDLRDP